MDIAQLQQAVQLAITAPDQGLHQQALEYCTSVTQSSEGWKVALQILGEDPPVEILPETSFFAYQVLEGFIGSMDQQTLETTRQVLWQHLLRTLNTEQPVHLKNKLAQIFGNLFVLTYSTSWNSFFVDMRSLPGARGNEMYMRILNYIHGEIGDTLILRDAQTTRRNNDLKDRIRDHDMIDLIRSWINILEEYSGNDMTSIVIRDQTLQVIAGWVSWVDIAALFSDGKLIPLIFKQFDNQETRLAACDTITEIVSKKMSPQNKLELLLLLDLPSLLKNIVQENDEEFDTRLARTLNTVMNELLGILDSPIDATTAQKVEALLMEFMPYVMRFFGSSIEITTLVIPCINEYLQFVRREAKKQNNSKGKEPDASFIPSSRREVVKILFETSIEKSIYVDDDWDVEDDSQDDEFLDLRAKLKVLQEQVATIDMDLFIEDVASFVNSRFQNHNDKSWQEVELALYELQVFGDVLKLGNGRGANSDSRAHLVLVDLFTGMINSGIASINHPSIQLGFMETVNRHSHLFANLDRSLLMRVLETFISSAGIHNRHKAVRERSWYLLFRVFKTVRAQLSSESGVASTLFNSISSLLTIDNAGSSFDKKLYLYELSGLLFVNDGYEHGNLIHDLLERLFNNIDHVLEVAKRDQSANPPADVAEAQERAQRTIMALGTFTKGMTDGLTKFDEFRASSSASEMVNASKGVIAILDQLSQVKGIRESCRFTFSRFVALMSDRIILEISQFINCLLTTCTAEELSEFLSFLGQLAHMFKYNEDMFTMFTSLCNPLFEHIFKILSDVDAEATASGSTDTQQLRREALHAYLTLIQNLFNNRYGSIFLVPSNRSTLESIMQSLFHYAGDGAKDVTVQKLAIVVLSKIVSIWGSGVVPAEEVGSGEGIALFDSPPIFSEITDLCWKLTTKPEISLRDAQTRLVVLELGGLQKSIWDVKGQWYGDLVQKYLGDAGMSSQLAANFVQKLSTLQTKEFKRYFYDFLAQQK